MQALLILMLIAGSIYTISSTSVLRRVKRSATITSRNCSSNNTCANSGVCVSAEGGHTCMCKAGWAGANCELVSIVSDLDRHALTVDNGIREDRHTGSMPWSPLIRCESGTFAYGFKMKFVDNQGSDDDLGVTELGFGCKSPDSNRSDLMWFYADDGYNTYFWGSYTKAKYCPDNYYIVGFNQQVDSSDWRWRDDFGIANYKFICRGPGLRGTRTTVIYGDGGGVSDYWGDWADNDSNTCRSGTAVCGMSIMNHEYQGEHYDDLAMVDTILYCCNYDDQPERYVLTNLDMTIDPSKAIRKPPKTVHLSTIRNNGNHPAVHKPMIRYQETTSDQWIHTVGLELGVSTTIGLDLPKLIKAEVGINLKGSYSYQWGKTVTKTTLISTQVDVTIPPRSVSRVEYVLFDTVLDIPYTADLTTYFVGTNKRDVRRISGVWRAVRASGVEGTIKQSVPI